MICDTSEIRFSRTAFSKEAFTSKASKTADFTSRTKYRISPKQMKNMKGGYAISSSLAGAVRLTERKLNARLQITVSGFPA